MPPLPEAPYEAPRPLNGAALENGEWVSVREAAKRLGIDPKSVRNRIARGTIQWRPRGNLGREVLIVEGMTAKEEAPGADPRDLTIVRLEERLAAQERLVAALEEQVRWLRRPAWRRWLLA